MATWTADFLPEWQGAGASDWQYNVSNSCGVNAPLATLSAFDDPEDLGAEAEERETFASYAAVLTVCLHVAVVSGCAQLSTNIAAVEPALHRHLGLQHRLSEGLLYLCIAWVYAGEYCA